MKSLSIRLIVLLLATAVPASSQGVPPEIAALRQRIAAIRAQMTQVTAAAEYATDVFNRDPEARFLFSTTLSPGLRAEFEWHTGASPEMREADDPAARGIVILPVQSWQTGGFVVATMIDRWESAGRPVIVVGSSAGMPSGSIVRHLVPNGAPDAGTAHSAVNEVANLIATWTLYVEFVGSATRHYWQPGIYVSHLVPHADDSNYKVRFRTPTGSRTIAPIVAGQLGRQYLDRVDSLLAAAAKPQHQALMQRAADSLRAIRTAGHKLFVGACGNYLQRGVGSPFHPVLARYDIVPPMLQRGALAGDAILWFGYDGYDCPHLEAAGPLLDAGFKVVVVADHLPSNYPRNVMAAIPLEGRIPENIGRVPFNTEGVGSASSVDALVHYLWLKRLVSPPR